ncbi:MAG: ATP-dependent Clp protease ATP-binding subunit [Candidatus Uhrbacteria bacterium]|nr:ATP-dependent Clp protease ATP-binding subunit [Candidatus Uhrbacteria bacterium]
MASSTIPEFTLCPACQGDPRTSINCSACRGAGVGVSSPDGYLVWTAAADHFSFGFRKLRLKVNAILHLFLAIIVVACFGLFFFGVARANAFLVLATRDYWSAHTWESGFLWLGFFLLCFLLFRLRVYSERVKPLPTWGKSKRDLARLAEKTVSDPHHAKEISPHFQEAAWGLVERAYALAEKVGRIEVEPVHLFAAALTSSAGGIFMTRLGMDFEKIKEGLVSLLRRAPAGSPTFLSLAAKKVLLQSYLQAREERRKTVGATQIFLQSLLAEPVLQETLDAGGYPIKHVSQVMEWIRIQEQLQEEHSRFVALAALKPNTAMNRAMTAQQTVLLNRYSEDLTLLARNGYIGPVIGREKEMEELLRAIESGRRSVILVGQPGSGKSALIEALARRMVEEDVPQELFDRRLVSVHLPQLVAVGESGMAAQQLLAMLHEVGMSGNIILVLSGIEALTGESGGGPMDLAETLASELDKGYFIMIGTTTPQAWTTYLERRSLGSKLVRVNVPDMEPDEAIRVLMAKSGYIEYQNHVFFSYAALEKAVQLAARYLTDGHLPESALEIAKEAAVLARKERGEQTFVTAEDMARIVHEKTNIPVESVTQDESEKLLNLEARLHERVIGQQDAVVAVSSAMRRARAGVREGKRPIANFLFMGPTGVGKTELAKALAAEYFGSEKAMIRLDMSEYQDHTSVARVIGIPGDERGGLLTEAVRKNPFTIVLLDELEKAHPDILTLFLQVMDDGRLTDGVGRTVDFTNVVLIATSNAGTQFIQDQVAAGTLLEQIKTTLLERELKGIFRPEFLNRFDGIIVFKPLTLDDVTQIAWLMIGSLAKGLEDREGITFRAEDAAVEELAKAGFDPLFGARPLRRKIQERVDNALADLLLRKEVARRDIIVLEPGGHLRVEKATTKI